jgi:dolichol-phosphate mannosyltransferase
MTSNAPATLIAIPTYNEAENVEHAVLSVRRALPDAHVLIIDDQSPDGTGDLADRLAAEDHHVFVLHHGDRDGLGAAYLAGFAWALERGYAVVGEFDADGSHPADRLPAMQAALDSDPAASLVIGSRWVRGGSVVNWPWQREVLSRAGNAYARIMLRIPVKDATGGFRLFRADALRAIQLSSVSSKGYCFQVDLTLRVLDSGARVVEVPIEFRERELGASKMSRGIVIEAMAKVTVWGIARVLRRNRRGAVRSGLGVSPLEG